MPQGKVYLVVVSHTDNSHKGREGKASCKQAYSPCNQSTIILVRDAKIKCELEIEIKYTGRFRFWDKGDVLHVAVSWNW